MTRYEFHFVKDPSLSEEFAEASAGELKVLVVLYAFGGVIDEDELINKSGLSKARVSSALALWQEAGVIEEGAEEKEEFFDEEVSFYGNSVKNEFEERTLVQELDEQPSKEIAATIRNKKLCGLFDEIAMLMQKPMLTPQEIRRLSELVSQYELSEEYILTLAAHLNEKGALTVNAVVNRATNLVGKGVNTADELNAYITEKEKESKDIAEYKKIFGINNRKISPRENDYLHKWSSEYCFGAVIVEEAYSQCSINTAKLSLAYIDKILTDWHEHSCKTLDECRDRYRERKAELIKEAEAKREANAKRRPEKSQPKQVKRYGEFDAEEAFKLALDRSFAAEETQK